MQNSNMIKAGLSHFVFCLAAMSWEFYLRHIGVDHFI